MSAGPRAAASSSVRPTLASGGEKNTAFGVVSSDPGRCQPNFLGRLVILEQALRSMQHGSGLRACCSEVVQEVAEVVKVRLIGTDVLRGVDGVEHDFQALVATGKALPVDVGQDH